MTTDTRVTLQNVAEHFDAVAAESCASAWKGIYMQEAAVCRAAQAVVDAAREINGEQIAFDGRIVIAVTPELVDDLSNAIAAFDKAQRGEP